MTCQKEKQAARADAIRLATRIPVGPMLIEIGGLGLPPPWKAHNPLNVEFKPANESFAPRHTAAVPPAGTRSTCRQFGQRPSRLALPLSPSSELPKLS